MFKGYTSHLNGDVCLDLTDREKRLGPYIGPSSRGP